MSLQNGNSSFTNCTRSDAHCSQKMASSTFVSSGCFVDDSTTVKALRIASYCFLILTSLLGNSLVISVVVKYRKMRKATNFFIANMAVADLIVTIVYMPRLIVMFVAGSTWIKGTFGLVLCKIVPFLHGVSLLVSILTLLLISIERLCAITLPLKRIFTPKITKIAMATVWVIAHLARMPYLLALTTTSLNGRELCSSRLERFFGKLEARDIYYSILLVAFYAVPLVVIIASYSSIVLFLKRLRAPGSQISGKRLDDRRAKAVRKVVRMMVIVTFAFVACWITYFVAQVLHSNVPCALRFWRLFLAHSNSALNPCIYALFNTSYRRCFIHIIAGVFTGKDKNRLNFPSDNRKSVARDKAGEQKASMKRPWDRQGPPEGIELKIEDVETSLNKPNSTTRPGGESRLRYHKEMGATSVKRETLRRKVFRAKSWTENRQKSSGKPPKRTYHQEASDSKRRASF